MSWLGVGGITGLALSALLLVLLFVGREFREKRARRRYYRNRERQRREFWGWE